MWLPYEKAAFRRFGKGKTIMTNATDELNLQELDRVVGGTWMDTVECVCAAVKAINGIQSVLGEAVDGIPPAPCHPKS